MLLTEREGLAHQKLHRNLTEYDAVMLLDGDTTIVGELDSAFESFNQSGLELGGVRDVQQRFINAGCTLTMIQ